MTQRPPVPLPSLFVLGAGRLGTALAHSLLQQGAPVRGVWNRRPPRHPDPALSYHTGPLPLASLRQASVVLLTVSDAAIPLVAQQLLDQNALAPHTVVLHCSGRLEPSSLSFLLDAGVPVGRMHPLQPIAAASSEAPLFVGVAVGIEGAPAAQRVAEQLVRRLGGQSFSLEGVDPSLYHAAAVFASNYVVTLAHVASQLMEAAGLSQPPLPLLLPLLTQAVENLRHQGLPHALTGPLSRGDTSTIQQHLDALRQRAPEHLALYQTLAQATLSLAAQQHHQRGSSPENLDAIAALLPSSPDKEPP